MARLAADLFAGVKKADSLLEKEKREKDKSLPRIDVMSVAGGIALTATFSGDARMSWQLPRKPLQSQRQIDESVSHFFCQTEGLQNK